MSSRLRRCRQYNRPWSRFFDQAIEISLDRILIASVGAAWLWRLRELMPPDNYFTVIVQSITELLTRHSNMFVAMGGNLFRGFAIILMPIVRIHR